MSKELKALNYLYNDLKLMKCLDIVEEAKIKSAYECLQQALQRLEAIDNANPSEAIEWLETKCYVESPQDETFDKCVNTIKQALIKAQEQEKVLSIIKEKNVDIEFLKSADTFEEYNKLIKFKTPFAIALTEEEFDLLKEVFRYENKNN